MKMKTWINWFTISYVTLLIAYAIAYFALGLSPKTNAVVVPLFLIYGILGRYLVKKQQKNNKNYANTIVSALIVFVLAFTGSTIYLNESKEVAPKERVAQAASKSYKIKTHFTNAKCKKVVANGRKIGRLTDWGSMLAGLSKTSVSIALFAYGKTVSAQMKPFKTAISKKTGVTFTYTYVIPSTTMSGGSGYVKNFKTKYEK